ncbi:MAG: DNA methyltransferase [Planctomycetales bacterium]
MLERNTIHNQDCIAGMGQLSEGTVDLAFADPPFNIGYEYDVYDDRKEREHYLDWSRQWIAGVHRALKPDGTFWLAIGDEYAAELKIISQETGFVCRSWVIWYYTFGVNCKKKFSRSHAHLFHFVKHPKKYTFNLNDPAIRVPSARQLVYNDGRADPNGRLPDDTWILRPQDVPDGFRADGDTWYFPRVAGTFKERAGFHGCQMPEQLLGRIIRASSNETQPPELVLDPFSGSGTTLVVAKKLRRDFIGFDLSTDYVTRGLARLAAVQAGDKLEGSAEPQLSAPKTPPALLPRNKLDERNPKSVDPSVAAFAGASTTATMTAGKPQRCIARMDAKELESIVVEAFRKVCRGFSVDRIMTDDSFRNAFLERCEALGAVGPVTDWNRALFRSRKAGRLTHVPTKKRTDYDWNQAESYIFASEIALRQMSDLGHTLDEVLCDPELLQRFDGIAAAFGPGAGTFEYRWGALKIRKEAKRALERGSEARLQNLPRRQSIFSLNRSRLIGKAGLYLITGESPSNRLYGGMTFDLSTRLATIATGSAMNQAWLEFTPEAFVQFVEVHDCRENWWAGGFPLQERLVAKFEPRLNFTPSIATNPAYAPRTA